jgi:hypothetical protein
MQLTKLRAAPVRQAEVPPCAPAGQKDGGHRFAADPQCSADYNEALSKDQGNQAELANAAAHSTFLVLTPEEEAGMLLLLNLPRDISQPCGYVIQAVLSVSMSDLPTRRSCPHPARSRCR